MRPFSRRNPWGNPAAPGLPRPREQATPSASSAHGPYVRGDKDKGEHKIVAGAAKNAPEQVRQFAAAIRALRNVPGAEENVGPLLEVADLLAGADTDHASEARAAEGAAKTGPNPVRSELARTGKLELEPSHYVGTSVLAAADARARPCALFSDMPWDPTVVSARCVEIMTGPATLTDAQVTATCPNTVGIGAGDPQKPHWILFAGPSAALAVHGAHYPIADGSRQRGGRFHSQALRFGGGTSKVRDARPSLSSR